MLLRNTAIILFQIICPAELMIRIDGGRRDKVSVVRFLKNARRWTDLDQTSPNLLVR